MTYQIYTHQQLRLKSIARLKEIYNQISCSTQVRDKRCKDAWITAITDHQTSKIHKIDSQAIAQSELDSYIEAQANAMSGDKPQSVYAPHPLTAVEITYFEHEYYADGKLVAAISYDHDLTQPWVVTVNGVEQHRASSWARCNSFIYWHYKQGTLEEPLPVAPQEEEPRTVNEQIACECQKYGFKLYDGKDIYKNRTKIGEVTFSDGNWWVLGATQPNQKRLLCDSLSDAVWWLSRVNISPNAQTLHRQQILHKPLEQLTPADWRWLQQHEIVTQLVAV